MSQPVPARRLWRRRRLLIASVGLAGGAVFAPRLRYAARGRANAMAAIELSPGAPFAFLSTDTVAQGEAFSLHLQSSVADSAVATFNGLQYGLFAQGDYLVAILAAGQLVTDEIEIQPGDYQVSVAATDTNGNVLRWALPISVAATDFPIDAVELDPTTAALLSPAIVEQELDRLQAIYRPVSETMLWHGLFQMPVAGPVTTQFGEARSYNGGPVSGHHSGVDLGADLGAPVAAGASGRVAFAGALSERGNFVAIDHGLGVYTGYAHLSQISISEGAPVSAGDIVGRVGSTGLSTGPHLHWECAVNGVHVDALRWTQTLLP